MNRLEFLIEMKNSLLKTIQSATAPIVEDKIEQLDRSLDVLSQTQWWYLAKEAKEKKTIDVVKIDNRILLVVHHQNTIHAYAGTCETCNNLLHVIQMDNTCKCMNCDKQYSFSSNDANGLKEYPVKKRDDAYYVGLPKKSVI